MNTKEIKSLIEKYFEGETSLTEELLLREYFRSGEVPEELAGYKPVFTFFEQEKEQELMNPDFDRALVEKLSGAEGKVVTLLPRRTRTFYIASLAAAAVLLIGVAVTVILNVNSRQRYSAEDQLAYEQVQEALMIVSSNLNCGVSQVRYLQAFDKGMEQVQMLSKFYEYQSLIINPGEVQASSYNTNK
jgi:hypothetical protein